MNRIILNSNLCIFVCIVSQIMSVVAQGGGFTTISNPKYIRTPALSCEDIKYIVDFHNDGRRSVANGTLPGQPKASDMQQLKWDERLAEIATNWTKKMIFKHNPNRHDSRFSVGENLFLTATTNNKSTTVEWKLVLTNWFNEHNFYDYQPTFVDPVTAHYTQMIWADITHIGCGTTHFVDSRYWLYKYYVCNYGPGGNWYGSFPYTEDSGENEWQALIDLGLMDPDTVIANCDNLCCDFDQCSQIYGVNCTVPP